MTTIMLVNKTYLLCLLAIIAVACKKKDKQPDEPAINSHPELVAACQHIEGGGSAVTGGDGGTLYFVSLLNDSTNPNTGLPMAGTLRYAVSQIGARRVVFTQSGTIHLERELRIQNGNLTIDGQSAPGEGRRCARLRRAAGDHARRPRAEVLCIRAPGCPEDRKPESWLEGE